MPDNYEQLKKYILTGVGIGIGVALLLIMYHLVSASLSIQDEFVDTTGLPFENSEEQYHVPGWVMFLISLLALSIPVLIFVVTAYGSYWWEAKISGVRLTFMQLIQMHLRGVSRKMIVKLLVRAHHAGLELEAEDLVNAALAEVDLEQVLKVQIEGQNAGVEVEFNDLAKHFLAEVDLENVMEAMKTAVSSGYELNFDFNELANHSLSKVDVEKLVDAYLSAKNGEVPITLTKLKEHDLANGDIVKTVDALIAAINAGIPNIQFEDIANIDLAGLDPMEAVKLAVTPKVVETTGVMGHPKDGVQLIMKVKVTIRARIKNLVGGAGEETIVARINEALVTEIGQAARHTDIIQSPFELADRVEQRREQMSQNTAFEVLSIDVSNIDIGKDVSASLRMEMAKTEAELARTKLIEAEEKVKKAMAAAFIDGNLTPKEYFNMLNTQADTDMRRSISERPHEDPRKNH